MSTKISSLFTGLLC